MKRFKNLIKKRPCVPLTLAAAVLFFLPGCAITKRLDRLNAKIGQVVGKLELLGETNHQLARLNKTADSMDRRLETLEKLAKRLGGALTSLEKKSSQQLVIQSPDQRPSNEANGVPTSDDDGRHSRQVIPWSAGSS